MRRLGRAEAAGMSAIARAAVVPVMAEPSVRAEQATQLVLGETADVLGNSGEWLRVRAHADGYEGWANRGYLLEVAPDELEEWRARADAWSEGARLDVDGHAVTLPLRACVAPAPNGVALPDGRIGGVVAGRVRPRARVAADALGVSPERWALAHFEGSPYQWGGVTPLGVDCSGLVQTTFAARGVVLPRDSGQQVTQGVAVPVEAVRPGDLFFFRSETGVHVTHVAFAGPDDTLIHSTISCGGVLIEPRGPGSRAAPLMERVVGVRRFG
jgi:gamma-D-glutamyl-L-lysine dipeptidyl-peptidase